MADKTLPFRKPCATSQRVGHAFHLIVQVIDNQSLAQSLDYVPCLLSHLPLMHHISLSKHLALSRDMHRVLVPKRLLPEIFNPHIKPQSLLIEKAACAYSTDSIHSETDDHTVTDDEFPIPTTDLDDSKHAWDIIKGSRSLSSDLVLVHISTQNSARYLASAGCGAYQHGS